MAMQNWISHETSLESACCSYSTHEDSPRRLAISLLQGSRKPTQKLDMMKSVWLETYFWGLGNIWNYWEYLRPSVLCHSKLTKHHLLLSVSWIRCVSLACKLSMAGSTRYLCGFHKSQLRAAIGCYYSVGKSWRACYLVTTGFERKWVFEAVVIKSEA